MDVLNFGHGVFIARRRLSSPTSVLRRWPAGLQADSLGAQPRRRSASRCWRRWWSPASLGWAFERVIVRPVYGQHLKQILITTGGLIVAEQLIQVVWGADQIPLPLPTALRGADHPRRRRRSRSTACSRWRSASSCSSRMLLVLNRTKLGLLIRAGVENREMVEALGYRIRRLFVGVFVAGSALAGPRRRDVGRCTSETLTAGDRRRR